LGRILHVVGARPNFMKAAPVIHALGTHAGIEQRTVHTGQHYDANMAGSFFAQLGLPEPDWRLEVGGGSHGYQTGTIMMRLEPIMAEFRPDLVVVVGDVNSTMAGAVVAAKASVPIAHVEAGLRSFDWSMPEEINRVITDRLASLLLTPSPDADENLQNEGVAADRIHFVGNVMIDTLLRLRSQARWPEMQRRLDLADRGFAVLTLHRPANVDDPARLTMILERLQPVAARMPIVFPVHPRTAQRLADPSLAQLTRSLHLVEPLGYLEFLALLDHAACVLTDSGGIQEETTVLGVPCFTLRDNTERPVTVAQGTNTLVGADGGGLPDAFAVFCETGGKRGRIPDLWDGQAGARICRVITRFLSLDDQPAAAS
jgi:UDP-N-acetylglucosamine 2-epimerase (non-hydrolysing)